MTCGKIVTAAQAVRLIRRGDTVATGGFVGIGFAEAVAIALEDLYVSGHADRPSELTLLYAVGQGDGKSRGLNHLAHPGLVKRAIGGHWGLVPGLQCVINSKTGRAIPPIRGRESSRPNAGIQRHRPPRSRGVFLNGIWEDSLFAPTSAFRGTAVNPGRKTMRFRLSHLALAMGALLPLGAEALPFSNGDFASPGLPVGTQREIGVGTEPTFWVAGGTVLTVGNFVLFYENGLYGLPPVPLVGFGGISTTGATLSQTFDTLAGTNYSVHFQVTPQQGAGPQSLLAQALNGSTTLASSSTDIPLLGGSEAFHFYDETFNFVAGSGSTTLRFTDTSDAVAAGNTNFAIGNVRVDAVGVSPVPEPETYGLMMAGLGVLGFAARRRRQRAVTSQ